MAIIKTITKNNIRKDNLIKFQRNIKGRIKKIDSPFNLLYNNTLQN